MRGKCCNFVLRMNKDNKISVVINTRNAALHLREVLEAVKDFDEIVVCDMESDDDTLAIAREFRCRVITFPAGEHRIVEPARDFAIHQAAHPWVLVVDADELITPQLRDYLYHHIASDTAAAGVRIPRANYFMGRFMHGNYPDHQLRFFRRDATRWPATIHAQPVVDGEVTTIAAGRRELAIDHRHADDDINSRLHKIAVYSDQEVLKRAHKRYSLLTLLLRPAAMFFKHYFLKGSYRDGFPGFIFTSLHALYQFIFLSKLRAARRRK